MNFKTDQEYFWAGQFGDDYILRNKEPELLASNLRLFSEALKNTGKLKSMIEFGANIGLNLRAIKLLSPQTQISAIEINTQAAKELEAITDKENIHNISIFEFCENRKYDLVLTKGVLIHINPSMLDLVYEKLYSHASKYILICEYYNPVPVSIPYRGHENRLFKRDFAGEILDKYTDVKLVDYGFFYKRDKAFPMDDITWFLLEKM
jgi:pseudaminic acid biosynthesis-associated methylase